MSKFVINSVFNQQAKVIKMELAKAGALSGAILNVFLYISAWFANLDSAKSTILFIIALIMTMHRWYRWDITSKQNAELKRLDIEQKKIQTRREDAIVIQMELDNAERAAKIKNTGS